MKDINSILLEKKEGQIITKIIKIIKGSVKAIPFSGNIDSAVGDTSFTDTLTFWYENSHIVGLFFLSTELEKLPESIGNLTHLKFLVIVSSQIQEIPTDLKKLNLLEHIEFTNVLDADPIINIEFPDIFQFLNRLKTLRIGGNFEIYIPPSFTTLKSLEELDLDSCLFFTNYTQYLQYTKERVNNVKNLPKDLEKLKFIYNKYGKYINELPKDFEKLISLQKLYLRSHFHKIQLPSSIIHLPNLKEINFSYSKIKNPEIVFNFRSLEILDLSYCELNEIPKTIKFLKNLKELDLTDTKLLEIPSEIIYCQNLEKLNLMWNNFFETFENWINYLIQLPKLKQIIINKGFLRDMPRELFEKKDLEIIGF